MLYIRYVDDVLIEWTHSEQELVRFKEKPKHPFKTMNFTTEKEKDNKRTTVPRY